MFARIGDREKIDVEQLRMRQNQRLIPPLQACDEAKKQLAGAIALVEAREREYREIQEDVRRNLDALDLVAGLASEADVKAGVKAPAGRLTASGNKDGLMLQENARTEVQTAGVEQNLTAAGVPDKGTRSPDGILRRSSRPLFPFRNSRDNRLSILQLE